MRIVPVSAIAALWLGATLAASLPCAAQDQDVSPSHRRIFGYQDARTGAFHPLARAPLAAPEAAESTSVHGTIQVTINIKIASSFPAKSTLVCGTTITAMSTSFSISDPLALSASVWEESAYTSVPLAGTTVSCTLKVPYAWVLPTATSGVTNTLDGALLVTVSNPVSTPTVLRTSAQDFLNNAPIPASGTTSQYTVNVTL